MDSESNCNPQRKGRLGGWIVFTLCLLMLSLGATSYHKIADTALIPVRLSLFAVLSILVVREGWNHRHHLSGGGNRSQDVGKSILQRCRRWYYDEERYPTQSKAAPDAR
jgi:hypothetical protein